MSAATTTRPDFKVGDKVIIRPEWAPPRALAGQPFIVESIGPVNTVARPEAGGRGIRYPHESLMLAPEGHVPGMVPFEPATWFNVGDIVTWAVNPPKGSDESTPYVVFKDNGEKVNVARLGGEDGARYFRAAKRMVVKRDLAWLAEHLPR